MDEAIKEGHVVRVVNPMSGFAGQLGQVVRRWPYSRGTGGNLRLQLSLLLLDGQPVRCAFGLGEVCGPVEVQP